MDSDEHSSGDEFVPEQKLKGRRGKQEESSDDDDDDEEEEEDTRKKRGRPSKSTPKITRTPVSGFKEKLYVC